MCATILIELLVASLCASFCVAMKSSSYGLTPLTQEVLDAALAPVPGIRFSRAISNSRSQLEKRSKDRFQKTENCTPIHSYKGPGAARTSATTTLRRVQRKYGGKGYENITSVNVYGGAYTVDVAFNEQSLRLILDTGSSDTWAVGAKANCTGWFDGCFFGSAYTGGFSGGLIHGEHLYVEYGGGEVVQGPVGHMDVSVAGIPVKKQIVGLANDTLWYGDNTTSGILGLAYPSITNVFEGSFGDHDPDFNMEYAPIFSSMVNQGLVDDYFSIAMARNGSDGALAFGGVPYDLEGVDYSVKAMTDIIITNAIDDETTAYDYSFYTIVPDGWLFGTSTDDRKVPYVIDSGTTFIYLPFELSEAINNAFEPAAEYDFIFGTYFTSCDATPPRVAVVIDGTPFWLSPEDLIMRDSRDPLSGLCSTTVATTEEGPFILGDVFLKNVLAVFDVGDAVMQFAGRTDY